MDILNDIFKTIQLQGNFYFRTDFSAPWATTVPRFEQAVRFHHVVQGRCWCRVEGLEPLILEKGDFILISDGASHILADQPTDSAPPLETVLEAVGYRGEALLSVGSGDPRATTQMICGHLTFGSGSDHPLLRALPPFIHISEVARGRRPWFNEILEMLVKHVFNDHPGSIAVVTRLSEVLFIEAIRSAGDEAPRLKAMIEGFSDDRIGRAIGLIHRDPAKHWTVGLLAREIGMSRTRFAILFHEMIGMGPIGYLAEWRLQRAVTLLTTTRTSIAEIARTSGYSSPAAFTRAFVERFGLPPRTMRSKDKE